MSGTQLWSKQKTVVPVFKFLLFLLFHLKEERDREYRYKGKLKPHTRDVTLEHAFGLVFP